MSVERSTDLMTVLVDAIVCVAADSLRTVQRSTAHCWPMKIVVGHP